MASQLSQEGKWRPDEVRAFCRDNVTLRRGRTAGGPSFGKQEMVDWVAHLNKKGWGVSPLAEGIWRARWSSVQHYSSTREAADGAGAGAALAWRQHGRPRQSTLSAMNTRKILSAAPRQCRRLVVPGLFGSPAPAPGPRSLKPKAERKGDKYSVNGQKDLDHAGPARRHDLNLCRTDPSEKKHRGILLSS